MGEGGRMRGREGREKGWGGESMAEAVQGGAKALSLTRSLHH